MNLSRLIQNKNTKLFFQVESIADLNATSGFIRALGIEKWRTMIRCGAEVTQVTAQKVLKGHTFSTENKQLKDCLSVKFDNEGPTRLAADGSLITNYIPYKYFVSPPAFSKKSRLRRMMKIKKSRKIIAVSCSDRNEANAVLRACKRLDSSLKPLFILGFRKPDRSFARTLTLKGCQVNDRRSIGENISSFGKSDIVILNTMGELFKFMSAADLAIIGHDRNIFEPALLGVPILFFECPLNMNRKDKKMANLFQLIWRKNKTAKDLLERTGGAIQIDRANFHRQIAALLNDPEEVIKGGQKAVRALHHISKSLIC